MNFGRREPCGFDGRWKCVGQAPLLPWALAGVNLFNAFTLGSRLGER